MRWPRTLLLGVAFLSASVAGCRNCDLVEAELRTRENDLRELRAELARCEAHNDALQREVCAIRQGAATPISPEFASQTYTLKQITLGRQTGGYDDDACPGDEALHVVIEPRDGDGQAIKVPASVHVEALEISDQGVKTPLCSWDLSPEQMRRTWRSGLLSTGYDLILPWKTWPTTQKLRVIVQLTLADGRLFEADKDVTIRLTREATRQPSPAAPVRDRALPSLPEVEVPLPPPRKVDPKSSDGVKPEAAAPAEKSGPVNPAGLWQTKQPVPIYEAVQIQRPIPLPHAPGEGPAP